MFGNKSVRIAALLGLAMAWGLTACDKGPAQKAGESVDHAVSTATTSVQDGAKDIKRDVQPGH